MCGISGFQTVTPIFKEADLVRMTSALRHRGPDAAGYHIEPLFGLGHRRLSIIDLSEAANQPMYSDDGQYVIVFNGEIYNFMDLAKQLDVRLKTKSDTEVLLRAFLRWGPEMVNRLNGMFAIAIAHLPTKVLYLFRDRVGIKPLYYFHDASRFIFSSELKSFYALGDPSLLEIDPQAIYDFLHVGYIPAPLSFYKHIRKFPAGSYAILNQHQLELIPYWLPERQIEPVVLKDVDKAKERLRKLLLSSVEYRMISDVPMGTFLSGGIDSSIVTAAAQHLSGNHNKVKTFSIGFEEAPYNELSYAKAVSKHLGTEHYERLLTFDEALGMMDEVLDSYDEPFADSSAFPTHLVSRFAREQVTVILSGDGGDETYLGYGMHTWAKRLHQPHWKLISPALSGLLSVGGSRYKRVAQLLRYPDFERIRTHIFSQEQYCFSEPEIQNLWLNKSAAYQTSVDTHWERVDRSLSAQEWQALFDLKYYLPDDLLVKVDRASMHYALEVRVPLLDYRLVSFALNLSEDLRKKRGITKYLLKQILYEWVPPAMFERPKRGFSIPLPTWLKGAWGEKVEAYLSEEALVKTALFNPSIVANIRHRFLRGENYLYNRIWLMMVMQRALLRHEDRIAAMLKASKIEQT